MAKSRTWAFIDVFLNKLACDICDGPQMITDILLYMLFVSRREFEYFLFIKKNTFGF